MTTLAVLPAVKPLSLSMQTTSGGGFIIKTDAASVYLRDEPQVWALMNNHVDPRLNVPPAGNC